MKRVLTVVIGCLLLSLCSCAKEVFQWSREGDFKDENDNYLMLKYYTDLEGLEDGWYATCFLDDDFVGGRVEAEGKKLKGDLAYEEGASYVITISEEGEDGLLLETENGKSYHLKEFEAPKATIFIQINTDGTGYIAYERGDQGAEIDDEYPDQSAVINLAEAETYSFTAQACPGWVFEKWTRNGEDYAVDKDIVVNLDESAEYVAVFEQDENWQNPLEKYAGIYQSERASATVEAIAEVDGVVTIEWANDASSLERWVLWGRLDEETKLFAYEYGLESCLTYDENGDISDEETVSDNCCGYLEFFEDGLSFVWHENDAQWGELSFERIAELGQ